MPQPLSHSAHHYTAHCDATTDLLLTSPFKSKPASPCVVISVSRRLACPRWFRSLSLSSWSSSLLIKIGFVTEFGAGAAVVSYRVVGIGVAWKDEGRVSRVVDDAATEWYGEWEADGRMAATTELEGRNWWSEKEGRSTVGRGCEEASFADGGEGEWTRKE